jgi:hypothetical protein
MKQFFLKSILLTFLAVSFTACEDIEDSMDTSFDTYVTFWSDFSGPPISVSISGHGSGTITAIGSSSPDCGESGNFTRSLDPGTYYYTASDGNLTWKNGSFTISGNTSCTTVLLTD